MDNTIKITEKNLLSITGGDRLAECGLGIGGTALATGAALALGATPAGWIALGGVALAGAGADYSCINLAIKGRK